MHIDRAGETVVFASAPENIIGPIVTEVLKSMHFRRLVCLLPSRLGSGWERAAAIMMAAAHGLEKSHQWDSHALDQFQVRGSQRDFSGYSD